MTARSSFAASATRLRGRLVADAVVARGPPPTADAHQLGERAGQPRPRLEVVLEADRRLEVLHRPVEVAEHRPGDALVVGDRSPPVAGVGDAEAVGRAEHGEHPLHTATSPSRAAASTAAAIPDVATCPFG